MINKEIIERNVNDAKDHLVDKEGKLNERMLRLLVQNVERETRQAAVKTIFACANAASSGIDVQCALERIAMLEKKEG